MYACRCNYGSGNFGTKHHPGTNWGNLDSREKYQRSWSHGIVLEPMWGNHCRIAIHVGHSTYAKGVLQSWGQPGVPQTPMLNFNQQMFCDLFWGVQKHLCGQMCGQKYTTVGSGAVTLRLCIRFANDVLDLWPSTTVNDNGLQMGQSMNRWTDKTISYTPALKISCSFF